MRRNQSKIAIVTGASMGIGRAIAAELAEDGYIVALLARDYEKLAKCAGDIEAVGGNVVPIACDVSDPASAADAIQSVIHTLGIPTALINNAGYGGPFQTVDQVTDEDWDYIFRVNVKSILYFCRTLLPLMKANGGGSIVNVSSIQGLFGATMSSTYVAAKHAVIGYTKAIAAEWGSYGINSNVVCPGYIETQMIKKAFDDQPDRFDALKKRIPQRRAGKPEEVAHLVSFLASKKAKHINGATFVADGGMTSHVDF